MSVMLIVAGRTCRGLVAKRKMLVAKGVMNVTDPDSHVIVPSYTLFSVCVLAKRTGYSYRFSCVLCTLKGVLLLIPSLSHSRLQLNS